MIHGDFQPKDQPKVAFFLAPWVPPEPTNSTGKRAGGADEAGTGTGTSASGGSHQASQRYTAPAQMQISKVRRPCAIWMAPADEGLVTAAAAFAAA